MLRARHRCAPQAVLVCTQARAVSHFTGKTVKGEILLLAHLCQCLSSDSAIHNRLRRMGVVPPTILAVCSDRTDPCLPSLPSTFFPPLPRVNFDLLQRGLSDSKVAEEATSHSPFIL